MTASNFFIVFLGGAIGSVLRYYLIFFLHTKITDSFPWGTFGVNFIGCFFIGIVFGTMGMQQGLENHRLFLMTGLLGGFTTFSSFALDGLQLWQQGRQLLSAIYVVATNVSGFVAVIGGYYISRIF